jgi:hypothetical protein
MTILKKNKIKIYKRLINSIIYYFLVINYYSGSKSFFITVFKI